MTIDYELIRRENAKYVPGIRLLMEKGILDGLYKERTHFIFELLQNAEDALARRSPEWQGERSVSFGLSASALRVRHFGAPFDKNDVRGVCGIGESTKGLTDIGRFGIGFKSVYAFTGAPQIHSSGSCFVIRDYMLPEATEAVNRQPDETVILLPFNKPRENGKPPHEEIAEGLGKIGVRALLFLRQIKEVRWSGEVGLCGHYLREEKKIGDIVRRVTVIGKNGNKEESQEWLVFSRPTCDGDLQRGHAEIAFSIDESGGGEKIQPVKHSPLVVFFPTAVDTGLGFLVQGPYRTTPARDNVPPDDAWNRRLVNETASLLVESLEWVRDSADFALNAAVLECLPLLGNSSEMFSPICTAVKDAMMSKRLLPRFDTGHVSAARARLGRAQELRELFSPSQLASLYKMDGELAWLSGEITTDRARNLHWYIRHELNVPEITPDMMARALTVDFMAQQTDEWARGLYEFLGKQPALDKIIVDAPIIRLDDENHVPPMNDGKPGAYLPSKRATHFPTVKKSVCETESARVFLRRLGLAEPHLVDDVIHHILPKYGQENIAVSDGEYEADIRQILEAAKSDSVSRRGGLISALSDAAFVKGVDAGTDERKWLKPGEAYIATERLKPLFAGIAGVWFINDACGCLRGDSAVKLLKECGAHETFALKDKNRWDFSHQELKEWREESEQPDSSGITDSVSDWEITGLGFILGKLRECDIDSRKQSAQLLWDELANLVGKRGDGCLIARYYWSYYGRFSKNRNAAFVRILNNSAWVPSDDGELRKPACVLFDSLGWEQHQNLLSVIRFKSDAVDELAREAGIEREAIDLLRQHGVTTVAKLRKLISENSGKESEASTDNNGGKTTRGGGGIIRVGNGESAGKGTPEEQQRRLALEKSAIDLVLSKEEKWRSASRNNPGYDLYQTDADGRKILWCEVKSLTDGWNNQPVALSHTQFEFAQQKGDAFWLYVVERADTPQARIFRIQNPAGKGSKFVFDHGWRNNAEDD